MIRHVTAMLAWVTLSGVVLTGCGGGMSTEDAQEECDAVRTRVRPNCTSTQAEYDACVACHEECGDACGWVDTACPYTFNCPEH